MTGAEPLQLSLSVRELVEFSARSGDLFSDGAGGPSALAGLRGHQRLQARSGADWQPEFRVSGELSAAGCTVTLSGRIDLLNICPVAPIVEEIKTTFGPPQLLPDNRQQLHWAQARVYACLLARTLAAQGRLLQQVAVRVSWFDLLSDTLSSEECLFDVAELEQYTLALLHIYVDWYRLLLQHRRARAASARQLQFPFASYRPQQQALARFVYRCIREGETLLLEAPTGHGKTVSVLFPAVKALGQELLQQVVYLTAKGSCQEGAEAALQLLFGKGLQAGYLRLQAKQKTCPCQAGDAALRAAWLDDNGRCQRTLGFYDRLPDAREACLRAGFLGPQQLAGIAAEHQLCPFALGLEMLPWLELVVCDYNYVFDPLIRLAHFDKGNGQRLLLVDEVHNLPDRARAMYSASLSARQLRQLTTRLQSQPQWQPAVPLARKLVRAISALASREPRADAAPTAIARRVEELLLALQQPLPPQTGDGQQSLLQAAVGEDFSAELADWKKQLLRYSRVTELFSDQHRHQLRVSAGDRHREVESQLLCLDARHFLAAIYRRARSFTAFSATLRPLDFYADQLGLENEHRLQLASAFPVANQLLLIADFIDTRWQQREQSVLPLVELVAAVARAKAGNYLVFFPSYSYLQTVLQALVGRYPELRTVEQASAESEEARQQFVQAFTADSQPKVGFAVLGGIYAEAVDYIGESLSGAIVVSPGLPQPSATQKLLQQYYQDRGLDGFEFAFQFPGFSRVQQAAGRVIRSSSDHGVVILVDPRYRQQRYQRLFPPHWRPRVGASQDEVSACLHEFWQRRQDCPS